MERIRVAVADDSSFVRRAVVRLLADHGKLTVVGAAASGEELLANLRSWKPDVITLDLAMPGMGGLATLDRIMESDPRPIIIFSTHSGEGAPQTIEALHRGAVDFIDKQQYSLVDFESLRTVLVDKILEVCRRPVHARPSRHDAPIEAGESSLGGGFAALVIGASTGGPPALQQILEDLGSDISVPVAIAQHMPEGFTRAFANRLNSHLPVAVREAENREPLLAGTVYIAPATYHLTFSQADGRLRARVRRHPKGLQHRPSVDILFSSASSVLGNRVVAVLLTGMGRDGARGMAELHAAGAYTVAQDEASSVVYSMPGTAVAQGSVREIVGLDAIGSRLRAILAL